jgi:hypothetical protein
VKSKWLQGFIYSPYRHSAVVPNKPFKEGDFPRAQDDIAPQVDTLHPFQNLFCLLTINAQASEDSVVLNLDNALSKAYEEIEELRRRVIELETQAAELLKSNAPKGEL